MSPSSSDSAEYPVDDLLDHSGWLRSLALGLVRGDDQAEDILQQTWVAALENPPRAKAAAAGWLRRVLFNRAARTHRSDARRQRREHLVARKERLPAAEDLLERAELQRRVANAVMGLKEPYRSAVLLRYYEDLTPQEIADQLGVPVATIWTRLSRAQQQLKERLDQDYGSRAAWCAPLLPLLGADLGLSSQSGSVGGASGSSSFLSTAILTGTAAITIVGGVLLGRGPLAPQPSTSPSPAVTTGEKTNWTALENERDNLRLVVSEAESQQQQLASERDRLSEEARELAVTVEERRGALDEAEDSIEIERIPLDQLPISFGPHADLPGLLSADWNRLVADLRDIQVLLNALEAEEAGHDTDMASKIQGAQANMRVIQFLSTVDELPTQATSIRRVVGVCGHPLPVANYMAFALEEAGVPLSNEQIQSIVEEGERYERRWADADRSYTETTFQLRRVYDEIMLRNEFMDHLQTVLEPGQRPLIFTPDRRDAMRQVFAPFRLLTEEPRHLRYTSEEELKQKLVAHTARHLGLSESDLADADEFVRWRDQASTARLNPDDPANITVILGLIGAQLEAYESILARFALPPETRERVISNMSYVVPLPPR